MYKPFSKVTPPAKPNSFESAIWKYATCSLTEQIPEPQTRIEQLAQEFVFDKKTSSNITKLKEITRCISVYEARAEYEQNPNEFRSDLIPLKINFSYGKGESPSVEEKSSEQSGSSTEESSIITFTSDIDGKMVSYQQPEEQANFMAHVNKLGTTEFNSMQEVQQAHQRLLNSIEGPIYKSLGQNDRGQVKFTLKQLATQKDQLEEKECAQQKRDIDDVSAGRADMPVEDIAKAYREEPQGPLEQLGIVKKTPDEDLPSEEELLKQIQDIQDKYRTEGGVPEHVRREQIDPLDQKLRRRQALDRANATKEEKTSRLT